MVFGGDLVSVAVRGRLSEIVCVSSVLDRLVLPADSVRVSEKVSLSLIGSESESETSLETVPLSSIFERVPEGSDSVPDLVKERVLDSVATKVSVLVSLTESDPVRVPDIDPVPVSVSVKCDSV